MLYRTFIYLCIIIYLFSCKREIPSLWPSPHFILTSDKNTHFESNKLKGEIWIAGFVFTRCKSYCPIIVSELKKIDKQLDGKINIVLFSVDPEYDTPSILAKFKEDNNLKDNWILLTGSEDNIKEVVINGFKLGIGTNNGELFHSAKVALIDEEGIIRGFYQTTSRDEMEKLIKDIKILVN